MRCGSLRPNRQVASGSIVMLTMAMLLAMTTQVLLLGLVISRSLTQESVYSSQSVAAKSAAETGLERLHQALLAYAQTTTPTSTNVLANYGSGQASALTNVTLAAKNPETGVSASLPITVTAYVGQARGNFYELISTATYRDVVITSRKWIQLDKCQLSGISSTVLTSFVDSNGRSSSSNWEGWTADPLNHRMMGLTYDQPSTDGFASFIVSTTSSGMVTINNVDYSSVGYSPHYGDSRYYDVYTGNLYYQDINSGRIVKSDNSFTAIPNGASQLDEWVVNPNTGLLYFYGFGAAATQGLYRYNPSTGTSTKLITLNLDAADYKIYLVPATGRIYMAHTDSTTARPIYSWQDATGLSTVATVRNPNYALAINTSTGRIYFSDTDASAQTFYTWLNGVLSTIATTGNNIGSIDNTAVDVSRDRVYFTGTALSGSGSRLFSWSVADGLSTLHTISSGTINNGFIENKTGRYIYGDANNFYEFNPALNTILTIMARPGTWVSTYIRPANYHPLLNARLKNGLDGDQPIAYFSNDSPLLGSGSDVVYLSSADTTQDWYIYNPSVSAVTLMPAKRSRDPIAVNPSNGQVFYRGSNKNYLYTPAANTLSTFNFTTSTEQNYSTGLTVHGIYDNNVLWNDSTAFWQTWQSSGNIVRVYRANLAGNANCD